MRRPALAATLIGGAFLAGCGGGDNSNSLVVSAASSLKPAFTSYADEAGIDAKRSFAGSDELAAQIRQGVKPDVYAAANTSLPEELYNERLVGKPVVFARNTLVIAVPSESAIDTIDDLARAGTSLAIAAASVPVGSYTREVVDRLPVSKRRAIAANVRSEEPDVAGIVGKLSQGAVDAGFVYITDVVASDGALRAVRLAGSLKPDVEYSVAFVLFIALAICLAFLTIPVVAIFVDTPPAELVDSLNEPEATDALWLSLKTSLVALGLIIVVGTPAAYPLATRRFRGRDRIRLALAAPQPLVAEVTATAARRLDIEPGRRLVAHWKATATRLIPD